MPSPPRWEAEEAIVSYARRAPSAFDLLITCFVASVKCSRRTTVCAPFPLDLFHTEAGGRREKDFDSAEAILRLLVPVRELADPAAVSRLPERLVLLLHWLVDGRRPRGLKPVAPADHATAFAVCGCAQDMVNKPVMRPDFVLRFDPEAPPGPAGAGSGGGGGGGGVAGVVSGGVAGREGISGEGQIIGFHGTHVESIHSILRVGIVNASGTALQRVGAAFGDGIYLSTDLGVAYSFSSAGVGWEHSQLSGGRGKLQFVLVCEVDKRAVPAELPETYMVVERCDMVQLKERWRAQYVFVYKVPEVAGQVAVGGGKIDRCTLMILLYAAMLVFVSISSQARYRASDLWDLLGVEWEHLV